MKMISKKKSRVKEAFYQIHDYVSLGYPAFPKTKLFWGCRVAENDHIHEYRQFAHVFHKHDRICVAREICTLPDQNLYGILVHEFGHLFADMEVKGHPEVAADSSVYFYLGIMVRYEDPHQIQTISKKNLKRIRGILD